MRNLFDFFFFFKISRNCYCLYTVYNKPNYIGSSKSSTRHWGMYWLQIVLKFTIVIKGRVCWNIRHFIRVWVLNLVSFDLVGTRSSFFTVHLQNKLIKCLPALENFSVRWQKGILSDWCEKQNNLFIARSFILCLWKIGLWKVKVPGVKPSHLRRFLSSATLFGS